MNPLALSEAEKRGLDDLLARAQSAQAEAKLLAEKTRKLVEESKELLKQPCFETKAKMFR